MPQPRFGLLCPDLSSEEDASAALTEGVTAHNPAQTSLGAYAQIPEAYPVRALGGLACEWSNGIPMSDKRGTVPEYVGLEYFVLPEAQAQWDQYVGTYQVVDDEQVYCTVDAPIYCTINTLVNGYWVEGVLSGLAVDPSLPDADIQSAAREVFAPAVDAVSSAVAPGALWVAPEETVPLPGSCDEMVTPTEVATALGLEQEVRSTTGGGGWSLSSAAFDTAAELPCSWILNGSDAGLGTLTWLPGGRWAAEEAMTVATHPSTPEPVELVGMAEPDSADIRCSDSDTACTIDMIVGGNWIQVTVDTSGTSQTLPPIDIRGGATTIAETVVANVSG
jgi:hypothetical protein